MKKILIFLSIVFIAFGCSTATVKKQEKTAKKETMKQEKEVVAKKNSSHVKLKVDGMV